MSKLKAIFQKYIAFLFCLYYDLCIRYDNTYKKGRKNNEKIK